VRRGTGHDAMVLKRSDLAGKTGSTNDHRDAWFVGFNGDLSTAVWVGFDDYASLGRGEFGAKAALPIWMDYMGTVLKGLPLNTLPMPPGITTVLIPARNEPDVDDVPEKVREALEIHLVSDVRDVLGIALEPAAAAAGEAGPVVPAVAA